MAYRIYMFYYQNSQNPSVLDKHLKSDMLLTLCVIDERLSEQ